jgi:hypothetical protein
MSPKPDNPQSPGNSPHDSKSDSDTSGDRNGGGGAGGGQKDQKPGKGTPGTQKPADEGGKVSDQPGGDAAGKKAGQQVRAADHTGSPHKEPGTGNGEKHEAANDPTAKDNAQKPQDNSPPNTAENENKPSGGPPAGDQSSPQAGHQGSGLPAGGTGPGDLNPPPASPEPEGKPDAPNLDFTNKQVDLALEHLKNERAKPKSKLLDDLGWTKEEAAKFLENMKKLQDSARQPGSEGEAAKKTYNEFLKNLDLHPHGTRISGGHTQTDDVRNVRDSGQMEPPAEWADLYHAYSRSTAGQK